MLHYPPTFLTGTNLPLGVSPPLHLRMPTLPLEMFLDGRKTHEIGVRCDTAKSKHGSYYLNPGIQRVT